MDNRNDAEKSIKFDEWRSIAQHSQQCLKNGRFDLYTEDLLKMAVILCHEEKYENLLKVGCMAAYYNGVLEFEMNGELNAENENMAAAVAFMVLGARNTKKTMSDVHFEFVESIGDCYKLNWISPAKMLELIKKEYIVLRE